MRARYGYTLIELAVTIVVVGIISTIACGIMVEGSRAVRKSVSQAEATCDAALLTEKIAGRLNAIPVGEQMQAISANSITLQASAPLVIARSGANITMNGILGSDSIASWSIAFYDADGALTATPSAVRRVALSIGVTKGGETMVVRTEVAPRSRKSDYQVWQIQ